MEQIQSAIKNRLAYSWTSVSKPFQIKRRDKPFLFEKGLEVGIRYSTDGKHYRLITDKFGPSIIFSLPKSPEGIKFLNNHLLPPQDSP